MAKYLFLENGTFFDEFFCSSILYLNLLLSDRLMIVMNSLCNLILIERMENTCHPKPIGAFETSTRFTGTRNVSLCRLVYCKQIPKLYGGFTSFVPLDLGNCFHTLIFCDNWWYNMISKLWFLLLSICFALCCSLFCSGSLYMPFCISMCKTGLHVREGVGYLDIYRWANFLTA